MQKISLFIICAFMNVSVHAQKLFSTKTGQIKFDASTSLEHIAAINNQVDSKLIDKTGQIVFSVLIKSFKFENQLMEDHFNENYMESTKIPKADFKGYIANISSVDFTKDGNYPAHFDGTLNIHGTPQKVSTIGTLTIANKTVTINGIFKIKLADYNVIGSYIGGKIANEAEITINCKYE